MTLSKNLPSYNEVHWISRNKLSALLTEDGFGESVLGIKIASDSEINKHNGIKSLTEINRNIIIVTFSSFSIFIALPFPFKKNITLSSTSQINEILIKDLIIGLVFIELGSYVLGMVKFKQICLSKRGTRYVKARHKAGGQSQRRFERNREKWINELYKKIFSDINDSLVPQKEKIHYFVLYGDIHVINDFMLNQKIEKLFPGKLLIRKSSLKNYTSKTLTSACTTIWSSKIYIDEKNAMVKKINPKNL